MKGVFKVCSALQRVEVARGNSVAPVIAVTVKQILTNFKLMLSCVCTAFTTQKRRSGRYENTVSNTECQDEIKQFMQKIMVMIIGNIPRD